MCSDYIQANLVVAGSQYSGSLFALTMCACLMCLVFLLCLIFGDLSYVNFTSAMKEKKPDENYWVVGLNLSKLFCVICKKPDTFPEVRVKTV